MLGVAFDVCRFSAQEKECVYDRHRDIIKRLKFITLIEAGERINVNTCSTSPNTLFSAVYRSLFKESRQKTFQFLNDVMDRSFELIYLYKESQKVSDRISCVQIVDDIMNSLTGIRNLQTTYAADRNFYCEMETLLASIYSRLAELYEHPHIKLTPAARRKLKSLLVPDSEPATPPVCSPASTPSSSADASPFVSPMQKAVQAPAVPPFQLDPPLLSSSLMSLLAIRS
jgi:hypothetical protein